MTLVKGATTWANLANDIAKLVCGEIPDDSAVTVASGDRWVRETLFTVTDGVTVNASANFQSASAAFTTAKHVGLYLVAPGVPKGTTILSVTNGTTVVMSNTATAGATGLATSFFSDTIRTPASQDIASGGCSQRTGYFLNTGAVTTPQYGGGTSQPASVCRVSAPFSSDPSTSGFHRWAVRVSVASANTVAGNYSTASLSYAYVDLDGNTTLTSTSVTPNAGGVATLSSGLQITVSDPSGILPTNTTWYRGFTSTYMYGVDMWPYYYRATSTAAFSVSPPGVAGTDYDIVQNVYSSGSTVSAGFRGSMLHGLGIKTATGLGTGALYTLSFNMALAKIRLFASATAGVLSMDWGNSLRDTVNGQSTFRAIGLRNLQWIKMFQTPASVVSTSPVQYWISVTAKGIVMILNGDPGATGKLGGAWIATPAAYETTYDVSNMATQSNVYDMTADNSAQTPNAVTPHNYWGLRRRQDNSEQAWRDWQTRWFRGEAFNSGLQSSGENANDTSGFGSGVTLLTALAGGNSIVASYMPDRQVKPSYDGKWWLYGFQWGEGVWDISSATSVDENRIVRGSMVDRFFFIPDDNWASGDELTDTISGQKYLLFKQDYLSIGTRNRSASNTFWGGVAIAEL